MQTKSLKLNFFVCLVVLTVIVPVWADAQIRPSSSGTASAQGFYSIEGEVQKPGRYPLIKGMRVKSAIEAAGGLTRNADPKRSAMIRLDKHRKAHYTIYFHADNALTGDLTDNFVLLDQDRMIIRGVAVQAGAKAEDPSAPSKIPADVEAKKVKKEKVFVEGEAVRPGAYPWKENMTVRDLIIQGGGTLKTSFPEQAELVSVLPGADRKIVNLKKAMDEDPLHDLPVGCNDRLVIKKAPDADQPTPARVILSGEVLFPGQYPITKGERLSSVIERAGGYTGPAYPRGVVFTKERVRKLQQNYFEEVAVRIEKDHTVKNKHKDATQRLLDQMKAFTCTGRIFAAVTSLDMLGDRAFDIELEDGDTFDVPSLPDAVLVAGAVRKPGVYEHDGQSDYIDYVKAAGGYAATADEPAVFVVRADGSTRNVGKTFLEWNRKGKRIEIGGSKYARHIIEPGDTIVVPALIAHPAWLREIRDHLLIVLHNGTVAPDEFQKKF